MICSTIATCPAPSLPLPTMPNDQQATAPNLGVNPRLYPSFVPNHISAFFLESFGLVPNSSYHLPQAYPVQFGKHELPEIIMHSFKPPLV